MTPVHQAPPVESRDWVLTAACRAVDPEIFNPKTRHESAAAIAICDTCPVLAACLKAALIEEEEDAFGPWLIRGGITKTQRKALAPKARRELITRLTESIRTTRPGDPR